MPPLPGAGGKLLPDPPGGVTGFRMSTAGTGTSGKLDSGLTSGGNVNRAGSPAEPVGCEFESCGLRPSGGFGDNCTCSLRLATAIVCSTSVFSELPAGGFGILGVIAPLFGRSGVCTTELAPGGGG